MVSNIVSITLWIWIYSMDVWSRVIDPWCPPQISAMLAVIFVVFICPLLSYLIVVKSIATLRKTKV